MPYADKHVAKEYWRTANRRWRNENVERRKARDAQYYKENRAAILTKTRAAHLKRCYGVTVLWYEEMLAKQDGRCAICKKAHRTGRRLAVDHCHKTGKVRWLLCVGCNAHVGRFESYLDKHRVSE